LAGFDLALALGFGLGLLTVFLVVVGDLTALPFFNTFLIFLVLLDFLA
jgi:hypothetical protein